MTATKATLVSGLLTVVAFAPSYVRAASSTLIDPGDSNGASISMAIGPDGLAKIAYYDGGIKAVKLAHCLDVGCNRARIQILEWVNGPTAVGFVIGSDGLPFVITAGNGSVAYHCEDPACTMVTRTALPTGVGAGQAIQVGSDGNPLFLWSTAWGYRDYSVWAGHCEDVRCSRLSWREIAYQFYYGIGQLNLAIGGDGLGLMAWTSPPDLRVAHCVDIACNSVTTATLAVPSSSVLVGSFAVGPDGRGWFSFADQVSGDLKLGRCLDATCSDASVSTLLPAPEGTAHSSLAFGRDGLAALALWNGIDLRVARCRDAECSAATVAAGGPAVGGYPSFALASDGRPLAAYQEATSPERGLHTLHCSSLGCDAWPLAVSRNGPCEVRSTPSGIDTTAGDDTETFLEGTNVRLLATPSTGDGLFAGWSGACVGAAPCDVTMDAPKAVTAACYRATDSVFPVMVGRMGPGQGRVVSTPAGIDCGDQCLFSAVSGSRLTLAATPAADSVFAGWSGACSGNGDCPLTASGPQAVVAHFTTVGSYHTMDPCRVLDSREPSAGTPVLLPTWDTVLVVAGRCGIPATAKAVALNVTVTQPTAPGDLRVYPTGQALPLVSAINFAAGQTRANSSVAALGQGGRLTVHVDQSGGIGAVHLILDVAGYFE